MSQQSLPQKFVFNEKIDNEFIFNLYENDYPYIAEMFATTLETFDMDQEQIEAAFHAGDLPSLKKAIHKMKPVFGFTGLLKHQEQISNFEKICDVASGTDSITDEYKAFAKVIVNGKETLQAELKRLTAFIS